MISITAIQEQQKKIDAKIYGRDIQFKDSYKTKTFYLNGKEFIFNAVLVTWVEGGTRYGLVLDPIVKKGIRYHGWPSPREEVYEEDGEAMRRELVRLFREHDAGKQQNLRNMPQGIGDTDR